MSECKACLGYGHVLGYGYRANPDDPEVLIQYERIMACQYCNVAGFTAKATTEIICSCKPPHCKHEDNCALYGEGDTPE